MNRPLAAWILSSILVCVAPQAAAAEPDLPFSEARAQEAHPVQLYRHAASLMESGNMEEAAFWFYAGQLRYRIHLLARPDLPPDRDPALFASLNSVIGQEVNAYIAGDPDEWASLLERVLAWDAQTPNDFTPTKEFPAVHAQVRAGLEEMAAWIKSNPDEIRAQRTANGLENR